MSDESLAEDIGDAAGERVAAVVTEEIASANADTAAAEQAAKALADGAMETERGHRIAALEKENEECRTRLTAMEASLSSLREKTAEHDGAIAALVMSAPSPSIPPVSEEPPTPEPAPAAEVIVESPEDDPPTAEPPPAPVKRKRAWI